MSDILRISTPIVNPNQPTAPAQAPDPTTAFYLQDTSKVIKTHNQRELYDQNTGLLTGKSAPDILMDLIQDPTVTATYLKNLSMIEEIYKLVPAHNDTLDPNIEKLFDALLIDPDNLVLEMQNQEASSTSFHGELFDFLRSVSAAYRQQPEVQLAIADFLKAVHANMRQQGILTSISNNLSFLQQALRGNAELTNRLGRLSEAFLTAQAGKAEIGTLKQETLDLLTDARNSLLLSDQAEKIISITIYNLSRYNSNEDFVAETAVRLRKYLGDDGKKQLTQLSRSFLEGNLNRSQRSASNVMDSLTKLIDKTTKGEPDGATSEKIDSILFSLLSSPCNFTPLLHYILPLDYFGTRAFTELWINPEAGDNDKAAGGEEETHILMVMDVDGSGRFEVELYVHGSSVDFTLFCPEGLQGRFQEIGPLLREGLNDSEYRFANINVLPLKRSRSLMEVFKSLPYKRVGVDVTV